MKTLNAKGTLIITCLWIAAPAFSAQDEQPSSVTQPSLKEFRITRIISIEAQGCIDCHAEQSQGIVADWSASRHAHANISCLDCHKAGPADRDVSKDHLKIVSTPLSVIVSPKDCSRCHPTEAAQHAKSKHAHTLELIWKIDPWLNDGMNNHVERQTGCSHCHGSIVRITEGELDPDTWPNVGVGRINPDGCKGSCSSCHTRRHRAPRMGNASAADGSPERVHALAGPDRLAKRAPEDGIHLPGLSFPGLDERTLHSLR